VIEQLKQEALRRGDRLQVVSIGRLSALKHEIDFFINTADLNSFQKWIVGNLYKFELPSVDFSIQSIIMVAIPHPAYAKVGFIRNGKAYNLMSNIMSDFERSENYLLDFLTPMNHHIVAAPNLPLKRLAVHSGLAAYGRNNITYVDGLGSFLSYAAYFSDVPCNDSEWTEVRLSERCTHCDICLNKCPTNAIRKDTFLIDNERCLSYLNENPGEWPEWLPLSAHHCVYDCLKCQIVCPMNRGFASNIVESIKFSEEETDILLSGRGFDTYSDVLKHKTSVLGINNWLAAIPRNLSILFELIDDHKEIHL
jgi:epoxyqueuosine reductase